MTRGGLYLFDGAGVSLQNEREMERCMGWRKKLG